MEKINRLAAAAVLPDNREDPPFLFLFRLWNYGLYFAIVIYRGEIPGRRCPEPVNMRLTAWNIRERIV